MNQIRRRSFLKWGIGSASSFALLPIAARAWAGVCVRTPAQTSGPFYPGNDRFTLDTDLTRIPGQPGRAEGQVVWVRGQVLDSRCKPIEGANVELWQACASGRYQHSRDPNPAPLDPNFRYWAETFTDTDGRYAFKTIIPGAYPASQDWTRPPHLHFRISRLGYKELVTQMYFKGEALNERDLILQSIPKLERDSVVVEFAPAGPGHEEGVLSGAFTITLREVGLS
jgi:protocatechuate 3,4-dioxygenase beta subunit